MKMTTLKQKSFNIRNYPQEPVVFLNDVKEWLQQKRDEYPQYTREHHHIVINELLKELE